MANALVTGCGPSNLGHSLALALQAKGWTVTASCRTDKQVEINSKVTPSIQWIRVNLTNDEHLAAAADLFAKTPLELLVNCAVFARREPSLEALKRASFIEAMNVNVYGLFALTKSLAAALSRADAPRFVTMGSTMGTFAESDLHGKYSYRVSKAAVHMAMQVLSLDPSLAGVCVTSIHPGWVRTKLGGPSAPLTPEQTSANLVDLFEKLSVEHNGKLLDRFGNCLPW